MNPQHIIRIKKVSIIVLGFILIISALWYSSTHGIVKVDGGKDVSLSLEQPLISDDKKVYNSSWAIVRSGTYQLTISSPSGSSLQETTVPNFLRTARHTFSPQALRKTERVAAGTLETLGVDSLGNVKSFATMERSRTLLVHPKNDPTGLDALTESVPAFIPPSVKQNNKVIGFLLEPVAQMDLIPTIYDVTSGTTAQASSSYVSANDVDFAATIVPSSTTETDIFGIYYLSNGITPRFDIYNGTSLVRTIENVESAASADNIKAVAISPKVTAIGFGDSYKLPQNDHEDREVSEPETKDYEIRLYDNSNGKQLRTVNLGKTHDVAGLKVSPDGSYVAVLGTNTIRVVQTDNGKTVFSYLGATTAPLWRDDTQLLLDTSAKGFYELNAKTGTAHKLFNTQNLTVQNIDVYRNQILLTGHKGEEQPGNTPLDGYVAYLDQAAPDNNELVNKLPYSHKSFKLNSLGDTIYAARNSDQISRRDSQGNFLGPEFRSLTTSDKSLRSDVEKYLKQNIANYQKYKIVYGENL